MAGRASGYYVLSGPGGEESGETRSCCHCQALWVYRPRTGSGIRRGFCPLCMAMTCGRPECDPCVPVEARLENIEAGRPELTPRRLIVPGGFAG